MKKEQIGLHAGILWHILNAEKQKMAFNELVVKTALNPIELATAIGWLSREDKILFSFENGQEYYMVYQECYY
ncbi:winged helix-turn-helix domain-containing protein [Bacteroides salyersiae]|uniref:winged helix-turn-helix domain-containing protein n=1 Tax=Bacteroides salyersiae TaxID=291644 RepID=UPI0018970F59|nr:winged helix-turn-helix domain-containing protein [Bacteroides salyersiae]